MYPKISLTNNAHYCEEGQVNPLQWKTMLKQEDGSFKDQSGWWICKDFLNDCVAFFREGHKFSIYSWNNALKVNDEGVWHLLRNISDRDTWLKNLEIINKQLNEDFGEVLTVIPLEAKDQALICIPPSCWYSTYRISLVTLLIRLSNYGKKFKNWQDFFAPNSTLATDKNIHGMPEAGKYAAENGFKVPGYEDYWYYAGPKSNSKLNPKADSYIIHNCGIVSWVQWINQDAKNKKKNEKCAATAVTTS